MDVTTGEPLFYSFDKFASGCGWPSFTKAMRVVLIHSDTDESHGMKRIEVRSQLGDAHLGHFFEDGPSDVVVFVIVSIARHCALSPKKKWQRMAMALG